MFLYMSISFYICQDISSELGLLSIIQHSKYYKNIDKYIQNTYKYSAK